MSRSKLKIFVKTKPVVNELYKMQFNRKSDVLAARLACDNADLLDNLFNRNLSDTNMCPYCNTAAENIVHYYIQCLHYDVIRARLVETIPIEAWKVNTILHGSPRFNN